jgi:hypothetical protein
MVSFKSAKLDKSRNVIELKYPNDISLLSKLSSLDGFTIRYEHSEISANENSIKKLKELGFVLSASLMNYSDKEMQKVRHVDLSKMKSVLPLYDYQKQGVMFIENKNGRALIADEMGLGKAQSLDSKILTPSGYKKFKDIKINTPIFGSDGNIYKISGIFPQGKMQTYKITFSDSSSTITTGNHLWNIITPSQKFRGSDYKTIELQELFDKKLFKKDAYNYFIPMTSPLKFKKKKVLIPPYILGVLIGDGGMSQKTISLMNPDKGIINELIKQLPKTLELRKTKEKDSYRICIKNRKGNDKNLFRWEIKKLGLNTLSIHKHIPKKYLYNSIENRIALLRGLCDTDGYAGESNEYSTSSKRLAYDFQFLVESLGGRATIKTKTPFYTHKGEFKKGHLSYRITFKLPTSIIPFHLDRKRNLYLSKTRKEPTRAIISIEKDKIVDCACIQTTATNKLYLTNNAIVTHNTVQALSWLNLHPDKRPAIVICPSSLKVNWYRECKKWIVGSNPEILESTKSYKTHGDILVINYDILHGWVERLKKINPQVIIADEAQFVRNPKAKRTTAFKKLNRNVDHLIGLTGTPIDNKPVELYSIISSINPTIFPNYYSYVYKFCGGKRNPWGGIDTSEATNKEELHRILKNTIMIRRMKSEVMKELPPKQIIKVPLSISNRPLYTKAENEFIQYLNIRYNKINDDLKEELKNFAKRHKIEVSDELDDSEIEYLKSLKLEKASALGQIEYLKQIAIDGKMDEIINWIENFLESGEKLVVFAIHKRIIKKLIETFPDCVYIHGGVSKKHRQQAIDDFQNNSKIQLFIANMQSAGVGITLTSASNIAIIQYPWSPSIINQAIDRVHRITQIHQVTAWMLVAENTIEEKIIDVLKKKEQVISQIIDGKEYEDISVVMELVDSYRKIKK